MNSTPHTLAEVEHTLAAIEETIPLPKDKPKDISHVSVDWICPDPSDILPLLASLSPEKVKVLPKAALHQNARGIPLTLRHSGETSLDIRFGKVKDVKEYTAFDILGAKSTPLEKAALSGQLTAGTGQQPPFDITDVNKLLRLLQEIHVNAPDDLSAYVESVIFEAPLDILDGFEVAVNPSRSESTADVIWFAFPAGSTPTKELSMLKKAAGRKNQPIVLPILGLPWDYLSEDAEKPVSRDELAGLLGDATKQLTASGLTNILPILPLYRNSFIPGQTPGGVYAAKCIDLLWTTTRTSGFNVSAWKESIRTRYDSLISEQMSEPDSVLGLLRQHALLKALKNIEVPVFDAPDQSRFDALQAEGEAAYGALAETAVSSREKREQDARNAARVKAVGTAADVFSKALSRMHSLECFSSDIKEINRIESDIPKLAEKADIPALRKSVAAAEIFFESASLRLQEKKAEIDGFTKDLKKRHAETSDEKTSDLEEKLEQVEMFWNDVVPSTLRDIPYKMPQDDIDKQLKKTLKEYKDYLNLTPYDENEFQKCKTVEWPKATEKCMKKLDPLLDDIVELWAVTIEQELGKLEDFRKEKFKNGQPIPESVMVKPKAHPKLNNKLDVTIPKKPGLFGKLASKEEQDKWHSESIAMLHAEATSAMKSYQTDVIDWLKATADQYKTSLAKLSAGARKTASAAKAKLDKLQSGYLESMKEVKRLETAVAEGKKNLQAQQKELEQATKTWLKDKDTILKTIDLDTVDI